VVLTRHYIQYLCLFPDKGKGGLPSLLSGLEPYFTSTGCWCCELSREIRGTFILCCGNKCVELNLLSSIHHQTVFLNEAQGPRYV
jgi:hypothetical protein